MNEIPLFFVIAYKHHSWNKELLQELCNIKSKNKIILMTNESLIYNSNVTIIYDDMKIGNPRILIDNHFNEIKNKIEKFYEKPL